MDIIRIIDEIESIIKESKKIPFSNDKSIIENSRILERLDRIRAVLPEELEKAKIILEEKKRIVESAHQEADKYIENSKYQASQLINNSEITQNAMELAQDIVARAEAKAAEIKQDADEYVSGLLTHIEIVLKKGLDVVIQGKEEIKQKPYYDAES